MIDRSVMAQYGFKQIVVILKLILQRFLSQFGRTLVIWVGGAIVVVGVLYLGMLAAVYVECWAFGRVTYFSRLPPTGAGAMVCSSNSK